MNYEHSNDTFERLLIDSCKQHLKPSISEYAYSTVVLNELWNGEKYSDCDNQDYYHEIKGQYTIDNVPVIVRIP